MVWKIVPQTTSHALFEMTTVCLKTSFESCSPLVNDPPRSARTHAISQPAAVANRLFCISLGSAVTLLRWGGQVCSQLVSSFFSSLCAKNYWNRFIFDRVIPKIKRVVILDTVLLMFYQRFKRVSGHTETRETRRAASVWRNSTWSYWITSLQRSVSQLMLLLS